MITGFTDDEIASMLPCWVTAVVEIPTMDGGRDLMVGTALAQTTEVSEIKRTIDGLKSLKDVPITHASLHLHDEQLAAAQITAKLLLGFPVGKLSIVVDL